MSAASYKGLQYDRVLLLCVIALLVISVVLVSSASVMEALSRFGDENHYLKRQLIYIVAALIIGIVTVAVPTAIYEKYIIYVLFITFALLLLVLIVGREINQAKRWIDLGFVNLQPAEILKLVWIMFFSSYCSRKIEEVRETRKGFLKAGGFIAFIALLLILQPDFGSLVVVTVVTMSILFAACARLLQYLIMFVGVAFSIAVVAVLAPYRVQRLLTFLDPWSDPFGSGYQLTQSLMAFGRGNLFGEGLGNSIQKLGYLPEAHTDFITSIFGEEFGFAGMCVLIAIEFLIVYKALRLSFSILREGAIFQGFVAYGIGVWLCLQTVINIGVASGGLPTKGLTLPLVSYGGSSLMVTMAGIAVLLRIDFEWRNNIIQKELKRRYREQKENFIG